MATIQISAHAAEFSTSELGFRCMRYKPFDRPIHRQLLETSHAQVVIDVMRRLQDRLSGEQPQRSFFVTARVVKGRSPNGFKHVPRFDYDAKPLIDAVDKAVAELAAEGRISTAGANA